MVTVCLTIVNSTKSRWPIAQNEEGKGEKGNNTYQSTNFLIEDEVY
ncbi:3113_t:CDS:2 [Funneliformis geosporum]|uniref:3113_t:CDS:1 n=1 Tax=Funneliformis geosporum TaxID=1117311 RepID=A0A9W4SJM6_9GLOM|nr:3113_t:CDS:2 [Funneliformis geosporum]